MVFLKHVAAYILGIGLLLGHSAFADPKPKGAKTPDPKAVAKIWAGNTSLWKSCKAGIYFGAKGQAKAFCQKKGESIGIGTWSINGKAKLCYKMTYYWPQKESVGFKKKEAECMSHLIDKNGQIWVNWSGKSDWWKLDPKHFVAKGFKYKNKFSRLKKKLDI